MALNALSNPNFIFLLLALGGLAVAFEAVHPTILTGVVGTALLVIGLLALGSLPTNWAGAALLALGFGLLVADVYLGSVGILAAGGIVSLIVGGLVLINTPGPAAGVSRLLVFAVAGIIGLIFVAGVSSLYRSRRMPPVVGEQALVGKRAIVRSALQPVGYVTVNGEIWKARVDQDIVDRGETVTVEGVRGLELDVQRAKPRRSRLGPPDLRDIWLAAAKRRA